MGKTIHFAQWNVSLNRNEWILECSHTHYSDTTQILLNRGAKVDIEDDSGKTALGHAMHLDCIRTLSVANILIGMGAQPVDCTDITGESWPHRAVRYGMTSDVCNMTSNVKLNDMHSTHSCPPSLFHTHHPQIQVYLNLAWTPNLTFTPSSHAGAPQLNINTITFTKHNHMQVSLNWTCAPLLQINTIITITKHNDLQVYPSSWSHGPTMEAAWSSCPRLLMMLMTCPEPSCRPRRRETSWTRFPSVWRWVKVVFANLHWKQAHEKGMVVWYHLMTAD